MRILYADCFLDFDTSMLLGALADLGADMTSIEAEIQNLCSGLSIRINHVKRCEIEAVRADVIVPDSAEIVESKDILTFTEKFTAGCEYSTTLSKVARLCVEFISEGSSVSEINRAVLTSEICTSYAVLSALREYNVEFVICSDIQSHDKADVLSQSGTLKAAKHSRESFSLLWNRAFLNAAVNDYGLMPEMDILKIGYGAGVENFETPNIIRAVLGEQHSIDTEHFYEFITTEFGVIS